MSRHNHMKVTAVDDGTATVELELQPDSLNCWGMNGMVLAIEPMVNEKSHVVKTMSDGWTTKTVDGGLAAHFEHTIAITPNGPVILTQPRRG